MPIEHITVAVLQLIPLLSLSLYVFLGSQLGADFCLLHILAKSMLLKTIETFWLCAEMHSCIDLMYMSEHYRCFAKRPPQYIIFSLRMVLPTVLQAHGHQFQLHDQCQSDLHQRSFIMLALYNVTCTVFTTYFQCAGAIMSEKSVFYCYVLHRSFSSMFWRVLGSLHCLWLCAF